MVDPTLTLKSIFKNRSFILTVSWMMSAKLRLNVGMKTNQ